MRCATSAEPSPEPEVKAGPPPYTFAAARVTASKIREARDFLEVPIAVENVSSYAEFHVSEMTEWHIG
ncbi:MAG TPA: DUF692 family protein [Candidatus Baltobacteraceae bacterium]|jgi:uncharacterized protein (UPF0276 family)|nr:DUF692 family protein [Candidatus Baltobacteraceae bacterium]